MKISIPKEGDYASFAKPYIEAVGNEHVIDLLRKNLKETPEFFIDIPENKWDYRYDTGKWNIAEVRTHIMDTEQIMTYRLLRIARGDQTPMPGFDQNEYIANCDISHRSRLSLVEEYKITRQATLSLVEGLDYKSWEKAGTASGHRITTSALCYMMAGHEIHHKRVIQERYL